MAAFPELGYGFHTNRRTIPNHQPDEIVAEWWKNGLNDQQRIELIIKEHPIFKTLSNLGQWALCVSISKDPTEMFDKYASDDWKEEQDV